MQVLLFWNLREFAGIQDAARFPLDAVLAWTFLAAAPVSLVTGYLFTAATVRFSADTGSSGGRSVALVYGLEAGGGFLGGLAVTGCLLAGAQFSTLILALCGVWFAGVSLFAWKTRARGMLVIGGVATVLVLMVGLAGLPAVIDDARVAALPIPAGFTVLESADTPYQNVTIAQAGESLATFSNGELVGWVPDDSGALNQAAVLNVMAGEAADVLVLGFGAENLVCELVNGPAARVTYVGVDADLMDVVRRHLPEHTARCLEHPTVTVVYDDARRFLAQSKEQGQWELVVLSVGEPRTARAARFYTKEFFQLIRYRLAPEGVFSLDITVTENVLLESAFAYAAVVHATLAVSFEKVAFTAGEKMFFFAGGNDARVTSQPAELEARWGPLAQHYPDFDRNYFHTLFETGRIEARGQAFAQSPPSFVATDARPAVYLLNLFSANRDSLLRGLFDRLKHGAAPAFALLLGCLLVTALLALGSTKPGGGYLSAGLLIFAAGFAGMVGQLVVVLGYQVRFGSIFAEFGLLNASFMLGLFCGATLAAQLVSKRVTNAGEGQRWRPVLAPAALVVICLLAALFLGVGMVGPVARCLFFVAPLLLGLAVGACLATGCSELELAGATTGTAALYVEGLDHLGAVAGSVLGGLLLLPMLGMPATLLLAGAAAGVAVVPRILQALGVIGNGRQREGLVPHPGLRNVLVFSLLFAGTSAALLGKSKESAPAAESFQSSVEVADESTSPDEVKVHSSAKVRPDAVGYGGPLEVLVAIDPEGRVVKTRLGRHNETPEYVYDIDQWMAGIEGKTAVGLTYGNSDDPNGVDAYTGATVTGLVVVDLVRAVGESLRLGKSEGSHDAAVSEDSAKESARTRPIVPQRPRFPRSWTWVYLLLLVAAGTGLYFHGGWRLRTAHLVVLAATAGLAWNHQLAFDTLVSVLSGTPPSWSNLAPWVMLVGLVACAAFAGAVFCGYLCPFGALTELLSQVGLKWRVGQRLDRLLRNVKYGLAVLCLAAVVIFGARHLLAFDPLLFSFKLHWDLAGGLILLVITVGSLLWYRPWCRYLCPLGAVATVGESHAVLGRFAPLRRADNCHLGVRVGGDWDCIRCNRCVARPLPEPRRQPAFSGVLLICLLLVLGGLGTWRVVRSADRTRGRVPAAPAAVPAPTRPQPDSRPEPAGVSAAAAADAPATPDSPPPPAGPAGPRLQRKDNKQYQFQRKVDLQLIQQQIDDGQLSDREADFYLPVPDP